MGRTNDPVQTVEAQGCEACGNTGLAGTAADAPVCTECNGSPYGAPVAEVTVEAAPEPATDETNAVTGTEGAGDGEGR